MPASRVWAPRTGHGSLVPVSDLAVVIPFSANSWDETPNPRKQIYPPQDKRLLVEAGIWNRRNFRPATGLT